MTPQPIDEAALARWLDGAVPDAAGPLDVRQIQGGASNIIYRVERGGRRFALRRPPAVKNDPTSNNMRREITLLKALGQTDIPHPRLVAAGEDDSVLGVPFALMEWVDGFTPKAPLPAGFDAPGAASRLAEELIDGLATVSNADWKAIGLEGFGKPDNFLERQVDRWLSQLERARSRDLPHLDALCDWLRANTPAMQRTALIHGDYQFINVMFAPEAPPRLTAIVDWESATIGDPLLDLGWVLAGWRNPGEGQTHASYIDWSGSPPRAEMAARYSAATGLDVANLHFYMTLALFKLSVIMEGWYFRYRSGQSTHPSHAAMETGVPAMLSRAAGFAGLA
jgi:aminoglycoside phosphotransferase (APT) family kinase protein